MHAFEIRLASFVRPLFGAAWMRFIAYLGLCAAYLQGGLNKLTDFPGAIGEMTHFGLSPAPVFAVIVIIMEPSSSWNLLPRS